MVAAADVGWGSYKQFEGPFFRGKYPYELPAKPTEVERVMAVMGATEGGRFDAFNGYDVCGWTSGLTQFCELAQYSVSDMLGKVAEGAPTAMKPVDEKAKDAGVSFKKNEKGRWRFYFNDARGEVDTKAEQHQLFYIDGDGTKGTWDEKSRKNAKEWAAAISSVWEDRWAQGLQVNFTVNRLMQFAAGRSKEVIAAAPQTALGRAFTAAYISFAGNNPARANKHLGIAMESTSADRYSLDWLVDVLKELTFGPNVAIYPHRYNAIRPVLESLYGIDLPDISDELKAWQASIGLDWLITVEELQSALISLGFDLGPAGPDGRYGPKTKDAVLVFEQLHEVPNPDGEPDAIMVQRLEQELEVRGARVLSHEP